MRYIVLSLMMLTACSSIAEKVTVNSNAQSNIKPSEGHGIDSFSDRREALAYAYGVDRGNGLLRRYRYLKEIDVNLNSKMTMQGFLDGFSSVNNTIDKDKSRLTIDEVKNLIYAFDHEVAAIEQELARVESVKNIEKGRLFLQKNKNKKNVVTLASGLQYRVLKKGNGKKVVKNSRVVVHYRGKTIDGYEFDSTYTEGVSPRTFRVNNVIAGWQEALLLMSVGDKWEVIVPASLGYGASRRDNIPANAVLVFDIELLDIKK